MPAASPPSAKVVRLATLGSWDPLDLAERNLRLAYTRELESLTFELRQINHWLACYRRAKAPLPSAYPIEAASATEERQRLEARVRRLEQILALINARREEEA